MLYNLNNLYHTLLNVAVSTHQRDIFSYSTQTPYVKVFISNLDECVGATTLRQILVTKFCKYVGIDR